MASYLPSVGKLEKENEKHFGSFLGHSRPNKGGRPRRKTRKNKKKEEGRRRKEEEEMKEKKKESSSNLYQS